MVFLTPPRPQRHLGVAASALLLLLLLAPIGAARAQVDLASTVTFNSTSSLFTYLYRVTNLGTADLAIVTFEVLPDERAVQNRVAPTGFFIAFDPGANGPGGPGLVSFLEDADETTPQTFATGVPVVFSFDSIFGPNNSPFTALNANGGAATGVTVAPAAIPEPSTLTLLGIALSPGLFAVRRRILLSRSR